MCKSTNVQASSERAADMSLLSNCLECVRTRTDNRYVSAAGRFAWTPARTQFPVGLRCWSDARGRRWRVAEGWLQTVGEQAQAERATWQHRVPRATEQNTFHFFPQSSAQKIWCWQDCVKCIESPQRLFPVLLFQCIIIMSCKANRLLERENYIKCLGLSLMSHLMSR